MNEKAEAEAKVGAAKAEIDALVASLTAFYQALGTNRHCRHINELWHTPPSIGLGYVPPDALEKVEVFIARARLHLSKSNGPLGKGCYFSLVCDESLEPSRLTALKELVDKETASTTGAPVPTKKPEQKTNEEIAEEQVARMEGLTAVRGDKLRSRPAEVASVVDAFNGATEDMKPLQIVEFLELAITYFNLPDITRKELLKIMEMIRDAESKANIQTGSTGSF